MVGHLTVRWIADQQGLEDDWYGGSGYGKSIYMYDPETKKIKQVGVDSGGAISEWCIWKEDGKWTSAGKGCLADGTKYEGKGTVEGTGPDTFAYKGGFTSGGKKLLDLNDVYRRASR